MTARSRPSAPVPPTQGAAARAPGAQAPGAEAAYTESFERMWGIVISLAVGAAIAGAILCVAWEPFIWIVTRVLTS